MVRISPDLAVPNLFLKLFTRSNDGQASEPLGPWENTVVSSTALLESQKSVPFTTPHHLHHPHHRPSNKNAQKSFHAPHHLASPSIPNPTRIPYPHSHPTIRLPSPTTPLLLPKQSSGLHLPQSVPWQAPVRHKGAIAITTCEPSPDAPLRLSLKVKTLQGVYMSAE